jgi:pyrroline-5-carboxylate reductase
MMNLGILGFGTMGEAIARGLLRGTKEPSAKLRLVAYDKSPERREAARHLELDTSPSLESLVESADTLLVAVKPQDLAGLLRAAGRGMAGRQIVSIVAGRSIATFESGCGTTQIARLMPNIAATEGQSFVGMSFHDSATEAVREPAWAIARAIGVGLEVPEPLLAAVTGISGSGIAFVLAFLNAMALGGVHAGMDYRSALAASVQTLRGAAALIEGAGGTQPRSPMELLTRVTSPAGTTIEGVRALEEGAFTATVMRAVKAAADRAAELERL